MKKSKTIKIMDEKYEIKKLPLRRYQELIKAVRNLPFVIFESFENVELTTESIMEKVPELLAIVNDDIIHCVSVASGLDKEVFNNDDFGGDDFLTVINAVLEVNNIKVIVGEIKKLMGNLQKVK